jgi:hypothetical protein
MLRMKGKVSQDREIRTNNKPYKALMSFFNIRVDLFELL